MVDLGQKRQKRFCLFYFTSRGKRIEERVKSQEERIKRKEERE